MDEKGVFFFKQLRARGVFKGLAVYFTSSLALLGAANLFSSKYDLSSKIFDSLLAVLLRRWLSLRSSSSGLPERPPGSGAMPSPSSRSKT
jgi:hypothetical protein